MVVPNARAQISSVVLSWEGVAVHAHRFGGIEFRIGKRELGHIHGDYLVDIPFPKKVRDEVVTAGQANPHHVLPESGWISFYVRESKDIDEAIALLKLSYDIALHQRAAKS
jgi:hypothetical protein